VATYTVLVYVAAAAQMVQVLGVVKTGSDKPVAHVNVQIEQAGSDSTTNSGEFKIQLPLEARFKIGKLMTLQVKRGARIIWPRQKHIQMDSLLTKEIVGYSPQLRVDTPRYV